MSLSGGGTGQIDTDLRGFVISYDAAAGMLHPAKMPAHEKHLIDMHDYVEWTGDVIRFEDVSDLGNRAERYYIKVIDTANPRTPAGSQVGFSAYFADIDAADQAKIKLDHKITIRGKLLRRDNFSKTWFLKDCKIV